jgi:N-acetylmuramoyl-L-alanine amidase
VIIIGRAHNSKKQGAKTADGLTEWKIAKDINEAILQELMYCNPVEQFEGTLTQRIEALNKLWLVAKYQGVIECHCNASDNPKASGFCTIAWHVSNKSIHLAECVLEHLAKLRPYARNEGLCKVAPDISTGERDTVRFIGTNKEYRKASWLGLLADTPGPAVIVEACYLTNPEEAKWISKPESRIAVGKAISQGIYKWLSESEVSQ